MGIEASQRPILVATDRSDPAGEAIRQAAVRAKACGARLVVLHVVLNPTAIHPVFPQLSQGDVNEEIRVGRVIAEQLSEQVAQIAGPDVEAGVEVDFGVPDTAIVRKAEALQAQLLVVASRGATGLRRLLFGSVAERVVRHAHCPVLVVRLAD